MFNRWSEVELTPFAAPAPVQLRDAGRVQLNAAMWIGFVESVGGRG
jgi:hypothetical protein